MTEARKKFNELRELTEPTPYAELAEFWSTLEPVSIEFMIGEWRGGRSHVTQRGSSERLVRHDVRTAPTSTDLASTRRQQVR